MKNKLLGFFCLLCLHTHAQDATFSQLNANPINLNPALTGVFDGQLRFIANYRNQYAAVLGSEAFRTVAASVEVKKPVGRYDFASIGITALRDVAGVGSYSRLHGGISGSIIKQMGGSSKRGTGQFLVAGARIGFGQHGLDWSKLWFSPQFDEPSLDVNNSFSNGETFANRNSKVFPDFDAGILWFATFGENSSIYAGAAMFHINQPLVSFFENGQAQLERRYSVNTGGELSLSEEISLLPSLALMQQGSHFQGMGGAHIRYRSPKWNDLALRSGFWTRIAQSPQSQILDAAILSAHLEMTRWSIGFSYDFTVSDLTKANSSRGAFEISLIYLTPAESRKSRMDCPRF